MTKKQQALYGLGEMQRIALIKKLNKLSGAKGVKWSDVNDEISLLGTLPELSTRVVEPPKVATPDPDFNEDGSPKTNGSNEIVT